MSGDVSERADLFCGCAYVKVSNRWRQVIACPKHAMDTGEHEGVDPPVPEPFDE